MTTSPIQVFGAQVDSFVHPAVNDHLSAALLQATLPSSFELQELSLKECSSLLNDELPTALRAASPPVIPRQGPWGTISLSFLANMWTLLQQAEVLQPDQSWDTVSECYLLPLQRPQLLRIEHRAVVFVPPANMFTSQESSGGTGGGGPLTRAADSAGPMSHPVRISETGSVTAEEDDLNRMTVIGREAPASAAASEWRWLKPVIEHLNLPVLDLRFSCLHKLCELPGLPEQVVIIRKLTKAHALGFFKADDLMSSDAELVYNYLSQKTPRADVLMAEEKALLLQFPMFPTWFGDRRTGSSLLGICRKSLLQHIACHPTDLPRDVQEKLLKADGSSDALPKVLGIRELTDADLIAEVLLPNLRTLSPSSANKLMQWIMSHWGELKQNGLLVSSLKSSPLS